DETDGVADLPMFHTGGNLFDKALAQVVVNIQLGIAGYFDHVGRYGFKLEHGEDIVQAKPDKVIQHDDVIFLPLFGKDHKTVYALWDFNQGIPVVPALTGTILHHDFDGQIGGSILQ